MNTYKINISFDVTISKEFKVRSKNIEDAKEKAWKRFDNWHPKKIDFPKSDSPCDISFITDGEDFLLNDETGERAPDRFQDKKIA